MCTLSALQAGEKGYLYKPLSSMSAPKGSKTGGSIVQITTWREGDNPHECPSRTKHDHDHELELLTPVLASVLSMPNQNILLPRKTGYYEGCADALVGESRLMLLGGMSPLFLEPGQR